MKDMKHFSKRALALFVALVMCLGMMNLTVFAAEGEESTHQHNPVNCATCGGEGTLDETADCPDCDGPYQPETVACEKCDGEGEYTERSFSWDNPPCPNGGYACNGCADCNCGYAWVYKTVTCETCNGTGEITLPGLTDCEACGGEGKVTERYYDYPNGPVCPNNGAACNGCSDCFMGLAWIYEDVPCEACNGFGKVAPEGADVCTTCGGIGSVTTQKDCTDCEDGTVDCTGEFTEGKLVKNEDGTGTVTYTCATCEASYDVSRTHAEVVTELGDAGHVEPAEGVETVPATCTQEGSKTYTCAVDGCGAVVTEATPMAKHSIKDKVCTECGAIQVTVYGVNMGHWYGYIKTTAEDYRSVVLGKDEAITANNVGFSAHEGRGEVVTNYSTSKTWQLVGFVPETTNWGERADELAANYVYTNSEQPGKFKTCGGLDEVKAYVEENGVLYGQPVTAKLASANRGQIVAVWFIEDAPVKAGQFGEYDQAIQPVAVPPLKEISTGVSIGVDPDAVKYVPQEVSPYKRGTYTVDMVIRIDANAPNDVHVNIVPGLAAALDAIECKENGGKGFLPGDAVILNISIDNQSGKTYSYVPGSGFVATNPDMSLEGNAGTGFDGFQIPVVENHQYSYIARRINNQPLKDLGLTSDISDEAVGAALAARGYGEGEELTNEKIAQTYLADYYLDYTNAARMIKGKEAAKSFQDLDIPELAVFTNGDTGTAVFESCQGVVEGLYYFYYGEACTYNGKSIYKQMQDYVNGVSELETAIPAALNGVDYDFNTLGLHGDYVNNAYQNTQFSFRMEFDLTAVVTPPPPVVPDPSYTSLSVNKVWAGDDGESRPASVSVQLYRDGESYGDPVTLDESNGWSHSWDRLLDSYTWTVGEIDVPEGYTASISRSGTAVTITNTYVPEEPEEPEESQEPEDPEEPEEPDEPEEPEEEEIDEPDVPQGDKPDEEPEESPEPEEPEEEEIDEPDVPQGDKPDEEPEESPEPEEPEEEIGEPDVPQGDVPQTGDELTLWLGAAAASGLGLAALGLKRREDEEA